MGRTKGVPNKITGDIREAFRQLVESVGVETMKAWLAAIEDPAKRLDVLAKLSEYVIPKLGRTEIAGDQDKPIRVKFGLD